MRFTPEIISLSSKRELFEESTSFRKIIIEKKVLVIRGVGTLSEDEFEKLCRILSCSTNDEPFISWDFGHILNLKNSEQSKNYIFSNEKVPLHWDGAFHETPSILGFQCIKNTVMEGRTIFLDSMSALEDLSDELRSELLGKKITYQTDKVAHYGGVIEQSIIDIHPETGRHLIRIGEEVETSKNPVKRIIEKDITGPLKKLERHLKKEKYRYLHNWEEGDILFADNYSLLHGREEIVELETGERHLRRIQIR